MIFDILGYSCGKRFGDDLGGYLKSSGLTTRGRTESIQRAVNTKSIRKRLPFVATEAAIGSERCFEFVSFALMSINQFG
jgi:hypothetical protein